MNADYKLSNLETETPLIDSPRLLFVGGSPRSGTTLVQNMLDSHPEICGAPEFHHIPHILDLRERMLRTLEKGWLDEYFSADDFTQKVREFIESMLLPLAKREHAQWLSEKTPSNVLVFPKLIDIFPEALFIHVVRDPRAIVSSMLRVGERAQKVGRPTSYFVKNIHAAIKHCQNFMDAGFEASRKAPSRVKTVVYERLVDDAEREAQDICEFLGLPWSETMLHPERKEHLGASSIVNGVWYTQEMYNRPPEKKDMSKWQQQLTPLQRVLVTDAFRYHKELSALGYDLTLTNYPWLLRNVIPKVSTARKTLIGRVQDRVRKFALQRGRMLFGQ